MTFPEGFLWGAATSAHQIEGNNDKSDWWHAEKEGRVPFESGMACDSYNRYEEDLDLALAMHHNAYRMSIEWSRIEPVEGEFSEEAIEHYRDVIRAIKERGMVPFITLHHFTNPQWFAELGGWSDKESPLYFKRYVEHVADRLGDEAVYWTTINEPLIVNSLGCLLGKFPPNKKSFLGFVRACHNMVKAHKLAYKAMKTDGRMVGIVKNNNYFQPYQNAYLSRIVASFIRYVWNRWFLNSVKGHMDLIGLNHYNRNVVHVRFSDPRKWFNQNDNEEVTDFGWEIYPESIYHVLMELRDYDVPVYVTENGLADAKDEKRERYIKDYLSYVHKAIEDGADVRGYFHWSLLDNFEWAEGFNMRFGLVHVDFDTFERTPRESSRVYGKICERNSL